MAYPIIGICVSKDRKYVHHYVEKRLQSYKRDRGVTWIMLDRDSIKPEQSTVRGRRWDVRTQAFRSKNETFAFPQVIYMQCVESQAKMNEIQQTRGCKIFNNWIFDKWQGWKLLAAHTSLRGFLPESRLLQKESELQAFLQQQRDVFIKPIAPEHGHSSNGIVRLKHSGDGSVEASYSADLKMNFITFKSFKHSYEWLKPTLANKTYMMQQTIETEQFMNGVTDIRLHMNKNGRGQWEVSHLLFRIAHNRSHIMPLQSMMLTMDKWKSMVPNEIQRIDQIEQDMIELGFRIGNAMDQSEFHMADIGIDLGMEKSGRLWIFEVNPLPTPMLKKLEICRGDSLTMPLEYARYLTH
ncbi:MAG: hypothetical protein K0Q73_8206 [Paenibacillus sp.]|nr:hypothetical protein [Paenibacillus sp.]